MPPEISYRIAIVVVVLLTMAVVLPHRLAAARAGGKVSHREEGYLFAVVLRLTALLLWITLITYLLAPELLRATALPLPGWLRWLGGVTGVLTPPLMYWTLSSLGKNLTDTVVTRPAAVLVTRGPYRWVRHPLYVASLILMVSVTLLSANAVIAVLNIIIFTLLAVRTPKEEQMLIARFGDDYRRYIKSTGRFLPRLGRIE